MSARLSRLTPVRRRAAALLAATAPVPLTGLAVIPALPAAAAATVTPPDMRCSSHARHLDRH